MTHRDIASYDDLQRFIRFQMQNQITQKRKTVEVKLDSKWFFKCAKFIMFILKNDEAEHDARKPIDDKWQWFKVIVNGYNITFRRYDL